MTVSTCVPTFVVAMLLASAGGAAAPFVVGEPRTTSLIGRHLELFRDAGGKLTYAEVAGSERDSEFQPTERDANGYGYQSAAFWLRFTIDNPRAEPVELVLDVGYELLDDVRLYIPTGEGVIEQRSGCSVPYADRQEAHRTPVFRLRHPVGQRTYYLRVATQGPMNLPLRILPPATFAHSRVNQSLFLGIYYGLMLSMLIYNLFIFLSIRERSYLYYAAFILAYSGFQLTHNGLADRFLWPHIGGITNPALVLTGHVVISTMVAFSRSFLDTRTVVPRLDFVLRLFLFYGICGSPVVLTAYLPVMYRLGSLVLILSVVTMLVAGVAAFRRGQRSARFYVLAWSILLVGILIGLLKAVGVLPISALTNWGYQVASAVEAMVLSLALADRINAIKHDLEVLNRDLENRVSERTRSLEEANTLLEELSHTDSLTGVPNRRYLLELLDAEYDRHKRYGRPLSLAMLDIDHFKQINDNYGHQLGDQVLMAVANEQRGTLRASDMVGRYGGEEFLLILPETDAVGAELLAQRLRRAIERRKLIIAKGTVSVTVSIGTVTLPHADAANVREAIRLADEALYDAKRAGRNRVVAA